MPRSPDHPHSAVELDERLRLLYVERALAELTGLAHDGPYLADLSAEIEQCRTAYVASAVTEIAALRAALSGPLEG